MRHQTFRLFFTLAGKDYAYRTWIGVPRVGERVMFQTKDGPKAFTVSDVLWGSAVDDDVQDAPTINILLQDAFKGES